MIKILWLPTLASAGPNNPRSLGQTPFQRRDSHLKKCENSKRMKGLGAKKNKKALKQLLKTETYHHLAAPPNCSTLKPKSVF